MIARIAAASERLRPETRGALGMVVATLFFVAMDAMAKDLADRVPPLQVVWARYTGQTAFLMLVFAPRLRSVLRTTNLRIQMLRSALLFGVTILYFTSLKYLDLAEAAALIQLAPLMIVGLAALVLREQVGPRRWTGVVLGLCGAVVILKPGVGVFQPAALLAVGSAFCLAWYQIATRMLGQADSIWTTMLYTTGFGTLCGALALPFVWVTPDAGTAMMLTVIGLVGFVGHLCLVWALGQAPASQLAPFNYAGLVWAIAFGMILFAEVPQTTTLIGAGVIVGAGLYVWHRERVRKAPTPD
ncbi:DMT family transporter [Limibaculum sp. FT325]|uniref:DMT family transporter n=1 Tax=Thermohalobaculum sediminis TaxID=2939436 RepID=UPI0020C15937|nr:DMT family transporter [Limibaculum sediminis]MCL5776469.1 DMT family transporter [Limibaculum sediminis]